MKRITIDPVTRIEGHAKIDIFLDEAGKVADTHFHVTQLRGFEKFTEGRPFYEMPSITARICGICPVSHLLASAKACDAIMAVTPPDTALQLRELIHCAQFVQSHALSFFHLAAPDLLLGFDSDPARRNIFGVIEDHPEMARAGVALRRFGQEIIEGLARERVHPSWIVPGGVNAPLAPERRDSILRDARGSGDCRKNTLLLQGRTGSICRRDRPFRVRTYNVCRPGRRCGAPPVVRRLLHFKDAAGSTVAARVRARDYARYIGEASMRDSYLKAPYFRPIGYPSGVYRVGPLARLNVAEFFGTPIADRELVEFRQRCGSVAHSSFHFHYARLLELMHGLGKIEVLRADPAILDPHVRSRAGVNSLEGVGNDRGPARCADPPLQSG